MTRHSRSAQACFVLNGITQFSLLTTRFIPARAEQDLEHYVRNELLNVAARFTDRERMEAWVELSVPGCKKVEMMTCTWRHSGDLVQKSQWTADKSDLRSDTSSETEPSKAAVSVLKMEDECWSKVCCLKCAWSSQNSRTQLHARLLQPQSNADVHRGVSQWTSEQSHQDVPYYVNKNVCLVKDVIQGHPGGTATDKDVIQGHPGGTVTDITITDKLLHSAK